jgi:hypothetical protein
MQQENKQNETTGVAPVGTWVLLCLVAIAMAAAWLFLYFGVFLPRGAIH